jgi:tRNA(fMet)-specific endonuclease VapC
MGLILDTSVLVDWERYRPHLQTFVETGAQEPVALSVITATELLHGVYRAESPGRRHRRSAYVEQVLARFPVVEFDLAVARVYAEIWAGLDSKGMRISAHDLIIGATALALGYSVLTFNRRDFSRIPGLSVELLETRP